MAVEGSQDQLAWEARQRPAAAAAAALAGILTFAGTAWRALALADLPRVGLLETLGRAPEAGSVSGLPSLRVERYEAYDGKALEVLASSLVVALGYIALGWALTYLAVATRARRSQFPVWVVYLPLVAGSIQALASVLSTLAFNLAVDDFLTGPRTVDAAEDVPTSGLGVFATLLGLPGSLGLALALILISLNAMRVGLLTRFMGVLGIIAGALMILPFAGPLPVVQCFWLVMLGLLILGRWPNGPPAAWRTGNAEPWPSSAQVREQRGRIAGERRGEPPPAAEPAEPEPVGAGPSPSASARKRKRKRR